MAIKAYKFTAPKKAAYVKALREGARRGQAAEVAGVHPHTVTKHIKDSEDFRLAVEAAEMSVHERVESVLLRKALKGDMRAIQFYLTNRVPERWQEISKHEFRGVLAQQSNVNVEARLEEHNELFDQLAVLYDQKALPADAGEDVVVDDGGVDLGG